jgi:hypothetical protein
MIKWNILFGKLKVTNMIYYKPIHLNGWEEANKSFMEYVSANTNFMKTNYFWNIISTELHKPCYDLYSPIFKEAGFNLLRISLLIVNKRTGSNIHQDEDFINGYPTRMSRINIPIVNCDSSITKFYSSIKWNPIVNTHTNGIKYTYHHPDDCKLESSVTLSSPMILRVRELHNVSMLKGVYPRLAISCAVDPDPVYLLEEQHD